MRQPSPSSRTAPRGTPGQHRLSPREPDGAAAAERRTEGPSPARLRRFDHLFVLHTQPGLEGVVLNEALARVPGARAAGERAMAGRNGMALVVVPDPRDLARLRCAEDCFAVVNYGLLSPEEKGLEQARKAGHQARFIDEALQARVAITPGSKAGGRLRFRVLARVMGHQQYRRIDLQRALERGIAERQDRRWRLAPDAEVEFWATLLDDELFLAVRLTDDRMRQRDYKVAHFPGSLRPSVAAALGWLSAPGPEDIVLDPLCGAGTILIERAQLERYRTLLGGDSNPAALAAARENVGPRYKPIELRQWNATSLPLADGTATRIITNLPWGEKVGSHADNRTLYPSLMREFRRVLAPAGRMVVISAEDRLMRQGLSSCGFTAERVLPVSVLGARTRIYVCRPRA